MLKSLKIISSFLAFLYCYIHSKEPLLPSPFNIALQDPKYEGGIMRTEQGGIIKGEGFRLQGQSIVYIKKIEEGKEVHKVLAKGQLMLDYHGQIFVGDLLEYDFTTKSGYVLNGRTSMGLWVISGKKILLHSDKSFEVLEASLTTSEDDTIVWEMSAYRVHLTKERYLSTKNIQFKFLNIPILWIPSFKGDLKYLDDSPVKYTLSWDTGQGPKISLRYRVYSWENFNIYLRGDYRYARGPGGALEMDYKSNDKVTLFQSKNYVAHDTFYNDDNPNKKKTRFRLQGIYKTHSQDQKGHVELIYDKISDKNMPGDFRGDDFELSTEKQTRLIARYLGERYITGFNVEPRINPFEGFKQELPTFNMHIKTVKLGPSPFFLDNKFNLSYLDYVYSNQLEPMPSNIAAVLRDFHSVRAETQQQLYLPLHYRGLHLTPNVGVIGIIYSNNPAHHHANQLVLTYGAELNTSLTRQFKYHKHVIKPYINYYGLNNPLKTFQQVYIFDINDGYHRMNMLKLGVNNLLYNKSASPFLPTFGCDLYALGFLGDQTFNTPFPKAGVNLAWNYSNLKITSDLRWNFNNHVLDFSNISIAYTFNANMAFNIEYRHRSRFDWRKDNHQNFILDVTQSISSLLDSPLSDGRNVLLAKAEIKLTPTWVCQLQMHNGWGRKNQPGYTEAKADFFAMLSSAWRLKLSYMYTTRGASHLGIGLDLVK